MRLGRALWLCAAMLAAGVGAELLWPMQDATEAPPVPATPAAAAAILAAEPYAAWTAAMLARPLFNPDRRPVPPAAVAASAPAASQQLPRLTGILVTPQGSHAIFAGGEGEHATIAGEGARVGAWQVLAIRAGEVQLSGPEGRRTVRPSYVDAPSMAASPPVSLLSAQGLLPALPQTDTRPFNSLAQPSGAAIFSNAPQSPAARITP